jgi:hypothetical protein
MSIAREVPCVIDIEASGFGRGSYPIEVGAVRPDGVAYCSLISPEPDWQHWESTAEAVHGITREVLQAHGKPAARVASDLNRCLHAQTVYTDAWYHDFLWLARLYDAADMQPHFVLKDLRQALDESALARWETAKADVLRELKLNRHRASNDARVLQQTWVRVNA